VKVADVRAPLYSWRATQATDRVREYLLDLIRNMKKPRQNLAQYQANVRGHHHNRASRFVVHTVGQTNFEFF